MRVEPNPERSIVRTELPDTYQLDPHLDIFTPPKMDPKPKFTVLNEDEKKFTPVSLNEMNVDSIAFDNGNGTVPNTFPIHPELFVFVNEIEVIVTLKL